MQATALLPALALGLLATATLAEPVFLEVSAGDLGREISLEVPRPTSAGPRRTRIALDLDGNGSVGDLGGRGTGADGVLVMHTATVRERSPWAILAGYDGNRDGRIDAADGTLGQLLVWVDEDADGVPRAGEIQPLTERGVTSLEVPAADEPTVGYRDRQGRYQLAGLEEY